jgi:hypothetical protein
MNTVVMNITSLTVHALTGERFREFRDERDLSTTDALEKLLESAER